MIKVLKRVDWDINFAKAIIEAYNSVSPLSKEEYQVLYAYLQFPQRYWRLANRYYYNEVNWGQGTFTNKLQSIINEKEKYLKLLDEKEEYQVLYAYLQFPQRYWRLANRYYYNEVNWGQGTFTNKLQSIINEKEKYLKLLDDFKSEYEL